MRKLTTQLLRLIDGPCMIGTKHGRSGFSTDFCIPASATACVEDLFCPRDRSAETPSLPQTLRGLHLRERRQNASIDGQNFPDVSP